MFGFFIAAAIAAPSSIEISDFERARNLQNKGHEKESLVSFSDFLRSYPKSDLADEARFHLAEIYFNRREYSVAEAELRKGLLAGDRNVQADIAVMLGEVLLKQSKTSEAKIEWEAVLRKFPKSNSAQRARILLLEIKPQKEKN